MEVAESSADDNAVSYVLPVLLMTSCLHVMGRHGRRDNGPGVSTFGSNAKTRKNTVVFYPLSIPISLKVRHAWSGDAQEKANDTIRYEMLLKVRSKADMSQPNLPHGTDN